MGVRSEDRKGNWFSCAGEMMVQCYWRSSAVIQYELCNLWQQVQTDDLKLASAALSPTW